MSNPSTVLDSSCLITLDAIGRLALLQHVFSDLVAPTAVAQEFGSAVPSWLHVQSVQNRPLVNSLRLQLGAGESEAIALASELNAARLVLDEKKARRVAKQLGLPVAGTVAVAIRAKQMGLITTAREVLDEMKAVGFHMTDALYQEALRLSNE